MNHSLLRLADNGTAAVHVPGIILFSSIEKLFCGLFVTTGY